LNERYHAIAALLENRSRRGLAKGADEFTQNLPADELQRWVEYGWRENSIEAPRRSKGATAVCRIAPQWPRLDGAAPSRVDGHS
jgi:hypothetical protein